MFVSINFLTMIKVGIIGQDSQLLHLPDLIVKQNNIELTGWYNENNVCTKIPLVSDNLIIYPTVEALFRYSDAIVISHQSITDITLVIKCLKHFKHVFLTDAQYLKYDDFIYLEKIAEESNVKFYPQFGSITFDSMHDLLDGLEDLLYIDINHTFSPQEGICVDGRFSLALLRDLYFLTDLIFARVKKVSANGWGFCEPGAGMLNAKIDFDNATSANLLLVNSNKPRQLQVVLYGKSVITRVNADDHLLRVTQETLNHGQINSFEKEITTASSLNNELKLFVAAIQQKPDGLRSLDNKYNSIRINHLIHEKINHFASINIFYS